MKQSSRQNKARYLQNLVKDKICKTFNLDNKDVRTSTIGENGEDVKLLTLTAKRVFPYATEVTNTEQQPLAVISLEHFFELLEKED